MQQMQQYQISQLMLLNMTSVSFNTVWTHISPTLPIALKRVSGENTHNNNYRG